MNDRDEFNEKIQRLIKTLLELTKTDKLNWWRLTDWDGEYHALGRNGWKLSIHKDSQGEIELSGSHPALDWDDYDGIDDCTRPWLTCRDPALDELYPAVVENEVRYTESLKLAKDPPPAPHERRDPWQELFDGL